LRDDGELTLVTVGENGTDISRVLRLEHDLGRALVLFGPISVVNIKLFFVRDDSLVSNHALEELHVLRLELAVEGVPLGLLGLK